MRSVSGSVLITVCVVIGLATQTYCSCKCDCLPNMKIPLFPTSHFYLPVAGANQDLWSFGNENELRLDRPVKEIAKIPLSVQMPLPSPPSPMKAPPPVMKAPVPMMMAPASMSQSVMKIVPPPVIKAVPPPVMMTPMMMMMESSKSKISPLPMKMTESGVMPIPVLHLMPMASMEMKKSEKKADMMKPEEKEMMKTEEKKEMSIPVRMEAKFTQYQVREDVVDNVEEKQEMAGQSALIVPAKPAPKPVPKPAEMSDSMPASMKPVIMMTKMSSSEPRSESSEVKVSKISSQQKDYFFSVEQRIPVKKDEEKSSDDMKDTHDKNVYYKFEYKVNDKKTKDFKNQKEERKADEVKGEYSLMEPDGNIRTVKYFADWKNGFHAEVQNSKMEQSS